MRHLTRVRAALAGTAAALCLASVLVSACGVRDTSFDYPAMRLTDPVVAGTQTQH
ncbi:MAG TPA: hypothetical protein VNJ31_10690 [Methyloceanibacter sp.]|nr:hypothetical protein [Methyloceanibacter sp.]